MRLFLFLIGLVSLTLVGCRGKGESFVIQGQILNASHVKTVVLYEGERVLDSVFLSENGKFRMVRKSSQPRLFSLKLGKVHYPIILQDGETLQFNADLASGDSVYEVSGSPLSAKIKRLHELDREKVAYEAALNEEFSLLSASLDESITETLRAEFVEKFQAYMKEHTRKVMEFAENEENLAGFYAVSTLDPMYAEREIVAYAEKIKGKFDDNMLVRQFITQAEDLKRLAIGQPAPDFESLTANNRTVKLSDFRGKYLLLDFWASWCVPCREENPNIVRLFHRYADQGFTVLGVSLDGNPGSWLKAVEQDKLEWTNVSDLQAWKGEVVDLYRISAIPTSYILDPDGIIVAKDLRGKALEDFLGQIF